MEQNNRSDKELDELLTGLSKSTHAPQGNFSAENSYAQLESRMHAQKKKRLPIFKYIAAASILLIACLSGYLFFTANNSSMVLVATTDHVQEVILPDGSEVTLSHYSTLKYPKKFANHKREVSIEGEAFFKVFRDTIRPFIAEANQIQVRVLGTQFDIQSHTSQGVIKATLLEGSVAVSNSQSGEEMILKPNQSAIFNKATHVLSKEAAPNAWDEIAWRKGHFIFTDKHLQAIIDNLSAYFNIPIQLNDPTIGSYKITARFEQNESLDEILTLLASVGSFDWERLNNEIIIHSN